MTDKTLLFELRRDEGFRENPYFCTAGKTTIGYGRNLDDVGISRSEAEIMLQNDVEAVAQDLDRAVPWWAELPEPARRGLQNMAFNLGISRLMKFKKMLAALQDHDWDAAAAEAKDSRWYRQVGQRAERICDLYLSCKEFTDG